MTYSCSRKHVVAPTWRGQPIAPNDLVAREVIVLRTLAHVGWLTTEQLHALCFPSEAMATVRNTLRHLEAAGWICHARWRIKSTSGSNVWGIGYKGPFILSRYGDGVPPRLLNLTRPSTAIEHEEWVLRLQARRLLVHLVLQARHTALLARLDATFADAEATNHTGASGAMLPDALLTVGWTPPVQQPSDWLPWVPTSPPHTVEHVVRYAMFFDRSAHIADACALHTRNDHGYHAAADHALIIVAHAAHRERVQRAIVTQHGAIHVLTWSEIEHRAGDVLRQVHLYGHQPALWTMED